MKVKLPGIASATKILATGEKVTYHYAWRGGPRLKGEPGSPEFILSYEQAIRERRSPDLSVFKAIIADYLASKEFEGLRDRTKSDYQKQIGKIERAFGDLPLAALDDPEVTKEFLSWRDRIPSPKQADYAWTVLMLVIAWGRKVGMTSYRPPGRGQRDKACRCIRSPWRAGTAAMGPDLRRRDCTAYVVTCMIAAGYRIDPTKESACYGSPTIAECFIPR